MSKENKERNVFIEVLQSIGKLLIKFLMLIIWVFSKLIGSIASMIEKFTEKHF